MEPDLRATAQSAFPLVFEVVSGPRAGAQVSWSGDDLVLGRTGEAAALLADDLTVSHRHAILRRGRGGGCVIEDAGSTNGTFVNGTRITGPAELHPGDELRLGGPSLRISGSRPETAVLTPARAGTPPEDPRAGENIDPKVLDAWTGWARREIAGSELQIDAAVMAVVAAIERQEDAN